MNAGESAPPAAVEIRKAQPRDLARVQEIYAHHVRHGTATFEIEPPPVEEMQRRFDAVVGAGLPWVVAEVGGVVVGFGYAGMYRPRPAYRFTVEDSVYLVPRWTHRGIGRAVLTRLVESAEQAGCRQMVAVIGDSANAASIAVHRALGFQMVGVLRDVGFKFGRWLDTVIMQRPLGPGAGDTPGENSERAAWPAC